MWRVAVGVVVGLGATWLLLLMLLLVTRPDRATLRETARLLPDIIRLVRRLAGDDTIPRSARLPIWLLIAYLAVPIDLVPDFLPVIGYADDAILTALVLRCLIRRVGPARVWQHWPGSPAGLAGLQPALRLADPN